MIIFPTTDGIDLSLFYNFMSVPNATSVVLMAPVILSQASQQQSHVLSLTTKPRMYVLSWIFHSVFNQHNTSAFSAYIFFVGIFAKFLLHFSEMFNLLYLFTATIWESQEQSLKSIKKTSDLDTTMVGIMDTPFLTLRAASVYTHCQMRPHFPRKQLKVPLYLFAYWIILTSLLDNSTSLI